MLNTISFLKFVNFLLIFTSVESLKILFDYNFFVRKPSKTTKFKMQNDAGEFVDLYCPRKCSASNRIIPAKDHASIQINLAEIDSATGRITGNHKIFTISGAIRRMGESDDCITRLAKDHGIVAKNF